jgi:hypothetical protein
MKIRYILVAIFVIGALSGCGKKSIEIDVSDDIQSAIEKDIPAKDYVFYVPDASLPQTMEDFQKQTLAICVSDSNIWISAAFDLRIANSKSMGNSLEDCLTYAKKNSNTIILTERKNKLPSDVKMSEIIFK